MQTSQIDPSVQSSAVRKVVGFFGRNGLWHILSRNSPATSCRDAAGRRSRLGSIGIPLYDEVKSLCVSFERDGRTQYALLNCRADSRFDMKAVSRLLNVDSPLERLPSEELRRRFDAVYGTVNPFSLGPRVLNVFDQAMVCRLTAPHTMMTNAGDFTWGIEFIPEAVIEALARESEVIVGPITEGTRYMAELPSFGIITGNGPESGMALWRSLNDSIYKSLEPEARLHGDLSYPRVVIESIPEMGLSMQLVERFEVVWEVIAEAVDRLCTANISVIAIACNTAQYYRDRIRERLGSRPVRFVSMPEVVGKYLQDNAVSDITILGIPVVANLDGFSSYEDLGQFGLSPSPQHIFDDLQSIGYLVKKLAQNEKDSRALNKLRDVLKGVKSKYVLIALTEISILLQQFPKQSKQIRGPVILDSLELYGQALAEIYLTALPKLTYDAGDELEMGTRDPLD